MFIQCLPSSVAAAAAICAAWSTWLAAHEPPSGREPTGNPWIDMDYGPSLTLTLEAGRDNLAYKGIAIRLDDGPGGVSQGSEFAVFDTDTLRFAASWMGPQFIDWRCVHFNGEHAVHPRAAGAMLFENPPGPGWAKPGTTDFEDQRLVGRDGRHYGPLARAHAHWQGHYHHGNNVVLSYTVGGTQVLELPAPIDEAGDDGDNELRGFARTLNIGPREQDLLVQVAHDADAEIQEYATSGETDSQKYVTVAPRQRAAPRGNSSEDPQSSGGIEFGGESAGIVEGGDAFDLVNKDFTIWAVVDTQQGGTIFAKAPAEGRWEPGAKALFIRNGRLCYDVGWVGVVQSGPDERIDDGGPHEVAMTFAHESNTVTLYVDGQVVAKDELETGESREGHAVKLGFASPNFPRPQSALVGHLVDVRYYDRVLDGAEIAAVRRDGAQTEGLVAHWDRLENGTLVDRTGRHPAQLVAARDAGESDAPGLSARAPKLGDLLCLGLVGGPDGCKWITTDDGHVRLAIPAGDAPVRLKVVYTRVQSAEQVARFEQFLTDSAPPQDLEPLTHGGPQRWTETVTTKPGIVGDADGPYVAESITVPHDNPYRSWMRLGGFDFFDDGLRAAVCTWQGDAWIVEGIGSELDANSTLTWRRIASGMFQPLGLKIVAGDIYVTCRDQITILRDRNGDGETDFYENFNNDHQVTDHFHEFAVGLQTDADGNFYYAKCARHALDAVVPHHGTLLKVAKDGSTTEIIARGYRAPNGVCVNDDGTFFLSDQEGHWTPKNRINWVKPGGFYGNMMAYHDGRDADDFEPPVCWMHNDYDRSPAEQVWVTSDKWGPLAGSLLTLSYGTGEIHLVLREMVDGLMQGGLARLPIADFPTGVMRGRFHPGDGQLYASGLFGWSSNKTSPGGFYRIRYTGRPVHVPVAMHATHDGLSITFTDPLDEASATNDRNWSASRWQYRRTQNYGSEDYRIANPQRQGRDRVRISAVTLSEDKRTVHLAIEDMQPAMQMEVRYQIQSAGGASLANVIHHTVHRLNDSAVSIPEPERLDFAIEERLEPGLIVEFTQGVDGGKPDTRIDRLPALFVPAGEPPTPFLEPGPFRARFRGLLLPEFAGSFTFHLAGQGQAVLRLNGREVMRGEGDLAQAVGATVELISDYTPLELDYESTLDGAGELQVLWDKKAGNGIGSEGFSIEPLPARVLWHDPRDASLEAPLSLRRGRELFATRHCIRCHSLGNHSADTARKMAELSRNYPDLSGIGSRLERSWLYQWIADPAALRNHVTMPQVFGNQIDATERQEIGDLVAFMETLQDDAPQAETAAETASASDGELVRTGEILYENLGCIACHRFTPPSQEDAFGRTTLYAAGAKFRSGALVAFLQAPHANDAHSRMPDFHLTAEEAIPLAAFIRSQSRWRSAESNADSPGDAARGRIAFQTRRCNACHEVETNKPSLPPPIPLVADGPFASACLAPANPNDGNAPVFSLASDEREAVIAFLRSGPLAAASLARHVPVEEAGRLVASLRCGACHARDGRSSVLSEAVLEEGVQGLPVIGIPSLTWAGEKLQRDWIAALVEGKLAYRARPWLKARMPAFPAYAEPLATGLPREHGVSGEVRPRPEPDDELIATGEKLTQQFTGFYCTECHAAAGRPPTSAFEHRGIDFPYVTSRLQFDYYHRWMRHPQRIDPSTKMPQFAAQPKPDVLDGNAREQFDAIWHYLRSLER